MLWQRTLTALMLIPLVIGAVFALSPFYFSAFALVVFAWGAFEWAGICDLNTNLEKGLFVGAFVLLSVLIGWCNCKSMLFIGALFWLLPSYWIVKHQYMPALFDNKYSKSLMGLLVLSVAWYGLAVIKSLNHGPFWIMFLFVLVWSCDSFAFFAGRQWGKEKLAPAISPKKTIEGFWGALIGTLILATIIFMIAKTTSAKSQLIPFSAWISLTYLTILFAVIGDLFESLMKRLAGVKDSGALLPGHGGLLDRIDSLLATIPLFALSLVWVST